MENALLTKINSMESKLLCDICGEKGDRIEIEGRYGVLCSSPKCYKQAEEKVATRKQKDQEEYIKDELKKIPVKYRTLFTDRKITKTDITESLFIYGGVGVGKTVYMASLVREIISNNETKFKWLVYPEFIMELQKDYDEAYEKAKKIAHFSGALFIDDLGAEKLTDYVRQITYYIINHREQNLLQTYITSNYSLSDIDQMIDDRVSSRIAGMCKVLNLTGKDRRVNNE